MFDATDGGPAVVDVDARLAKAQECLRDLHQCAPTIDVKVHMDSYHWLIAFLPAVLDQLVATLAEAQASPSLPDVKWPEALRFAADVLEATAYPDDQSPHLAARTPSGLRKHADRLEREQAAKTAQDHAIEQAAQVIFEAANPQTKWDHGAPLSRAHCRDSAKALADAGLLHQAGEQ